MKTKKNSFRVFCSLILLLSIILVHEPSKAQNAQEAWPRKFSTDWAKVIVYNPQPDSAKGNHLYARAAISIITKTSKSPVFGAIWMDAQFITNKEKGICIVSDVKLINMRYPRIDTLNPAELKRFDSLVEKEASAWKMEFALNDLKSSEELTNATPGTNQKLKNDPPEIIFLDRPSVLVLFEGDPLWKETGNEGLRRAVNTPYLVLQDTKENICYLYGEPFWYKSAEPVNSPWAVVSKPSPPVQQYFMAQKKEMEKSGKAGQKTKIKSAHRKSAGPSEIVVRTKPAELLQSNGEPQFSPIRGTQLLYMTNTDNNLFMTIDKNQYYVLLSGRWYHTDALSGPWTYAESNKLPFDFAKIPKGSDKDVVLASVAGTDMAKKAVLDANIPKTAAVNRKTAKCEVKWDGDPKFEMIKGTELARGMNTSSTVLLLKNSYFVCDNAVWFTGRGPSGPWEVATSVPGEVQKIPPDDPAYNVRYVKIYDVRPDVVYIGYTPGYTGCYVAGPTVVYGTGYTYLPVYGANYYPRPATFGFGMNYNPWIGWSIGFSMAMITMSIFDVMGYAAGWWGPSMYMPYFGGYYGNYYGSNSYSYYVDNTTINIEETNIYADRDPEEIENVSDVEGLDNLNYQESMDDIGDANQVDDQNNTGDQIKTEVQDDQKAPDVQDNQVEPDVQDNQGQPEVPADQGEPGTQDNPAGDDTPDPGVPGFAV